MNTYYLYYIKTEQRLAIFPTKMFGEKYVEVMNSNNLQSVKTFCIGFIMGGSYNKQGLVVKKDRKSTRLNSSHSQQSRMPSSA